MRFFFRSKQFKVILIIIAIVFCSIVLGRWISGNSAPGNSIIGAVISPFQKAATAVSDYVIDLKVRLDDSGKLIEENNNLKQENSKLSEQIIDYQKTKDENEFYKEFLEIKENNPDYKFRDAKLIVRDISDPYGGFNIDKGLIDGISLNDPVITSAGLVGYVSEVGASFSKVTTVLSPDINIGGVDIRTSDSGILSGDSLLAKDGFCKFYNLPRTASVALGDYITSSGGGMFPEGLIIGTVEDIKYDSVSTSLFASVKPYVDLNSVKNVMVITSFSGQGEISK